MSTLPTCIDWGEFYDAMLDVVKKYPITYSGYKLVSKEIETLIKENSRIDCSDLDKERYTKTN